MDGLMMFTDPGVQQVGFSSEAIPSNGKRVSIYCLSLADFIVQINTLIL